jgi:hypothetical protein
VTQWTGLELRNVRRQSICTSFKMSPWSSKYIQNKWMKITYKNRGIFIFRIEHFCIFMSKMSVTACASLPLPWVSLTSVLFTCIFGAHCCSVQDIAIYICFMTFMDKLLNTGHKYLGTSTFLSWLLVPRLFLSCNTLDYISQYILLL